MSDVIWIHKYRARSGWYRLDAERQDELRAAWRNGDKASSTARSLGRWSVRGQSSFSEVEVWSFPTVDDVFEFWESRVAGGYTDWFAFENLFGTR